MGEEKEILFKVLAVSHLTLAKFCLTPSFLKRRYNHMHSPCNQFMRANWEAIVCIRSRRVEEWKNYKKRNQLSIGLASFRYYC